MSKKNDKLEALRDAIIIRKKITNVLRVLALQAQKQIESLEGNISEKSDDERKQLDEDLRNERFNLWLIKEECHAVAAHSNNLTSNLRMANTIYPDSKLPTFIAELNERRVCMDRALGTCNVLQDELQYIAEAVYADKNKFTALTLDIEALFNKIKAIRQADNRFWRQSENVNQKV